MCVYVCVCVCVCVYVCVCVCVCEERERERERERVSACMREGHLSLFPECLSSCQESSCCSWLDSENRCETPDGTGRVVQVVVVKEAG